MVYGACPECDADVSFASPPKEGQRVTCPECTSVLIVIGENPIELDWDITESQEEYFIVES